MLEQNTQEWLDFRKDKIGASDAPIIMGDSPWKTPYQLWQQKLDLVSQGEQTIAMRRGHELEPIARKAYIDYTGIEIEPYIALHPEKAWMMASLDGYNQERGVCVEIKCPGKEDHAIASQGNVPKKYYAQLQHQLAVLGLNNAHYFSYREGEFHLVEVELDEKYVLKMVEEEFKFFTQLQTFSPPSLTDRDYPVQSSAEWMEAAKKWVQFNEQLKILQDQEKQAREELISLANKQSCKGGGVKLTRTIRKGSVEYKNIPDLKLIDLEKYRKPPVEAWRISIENEA